MSDYLAWLISILVLAFALNTIFSDGVDTSDDSIKDKIEIIEKAKNTDDPIIKEQGAIAKTELREIQQKKALRVKEENEKQKKAEAKEPFLDNPINAIVILFGIFGLVLIGWRFLNSRARRGY
jgi:hypothetical protein